MDINSFNQVDIKHKLEQGFELNDNEERYHMKFVLNYSDEMIDTIFAIAENDQAGTIID